MHDDGRFEWDEVKAAINAAKHGVSFEEAIEVFDDPQRVEIFDLGLLADDYYSLFLLNVIIASESFMLAKPITI